MLVKYNKIKHKKELLKILKEHNLDSYKVLKEIIDSQELELFIEYNNDSIIGAVMYMETKHTELGYNFYSAFSKNNIYTIEMWRKLLYYINNFRPIMTNFSQNKEIFERIAKKHQGVVEGNNLYFK